MMQDNMTFTLSDGRQLGYAEYGDPTGHPIFYFHGFPGSRLQAGDFHEPAYSNHCRFFGVDRPGMGRTSFKKQHTLLSWANDMTELADSLGIEKFSIIAHSGGAPFSLACGVALPERVSHIALVSAMPPWTIPEASRDVPMGFRMINVLVRNVPGFAWLLMQLQKHVLLKPAMFERLIQQVPPVDRTVLKTNSGLLVAAKEAFRQSTTGAAYEFRLITKEWGFKLEDIHIPISIWQGELDPQVPVSSARFFASRLPNSNLRLMENDAHQSTLYNHIEEIFEVIVP
jgi:pimeloyl-ACP methyl ester carboxylesterase